MFRLVVLSAFVAIAVAAPSVLHEAPSVVAYSSPIVSKTIIEQPLIEKTVVKPEYSVVEQPTVRHVGNVVKSIPTAVSHQSSTVVHNSNVLAEPILEHGVQRSVISTPRLEKHVVAAPAIQKTYISQPQIAYAAAPAYSYAAAPALRLAQSPVLSYSASPALSYAAAPALSYGQSLSYAPSLSYSHGPALTYNAW